VLSSPLSRDVLDWVATSAGAAGARWSRRLVGGTHAVTDVVRTEDGRDLVLRRFPVGDSAVHRESRVLRALGGLGGLVPSLVAVDCDGAQTGAPAILTTLLSGSACIVATNPSDFAAQLGRVLAHVHAQSPGRELPDVLTAPAAGPDPAIDDVLEAWARLSAGPRVLTHYDFWSGNTLWEGGRLSGVVDWSGAGLAPRGVDISWARLDLFLLFDEDIADVLTSAYQRVAATEISDLALWDLYAATNADSGIEGWAPNYQELGLNDLGPLVLRQRLTEWMSLARRRLH